MDITAQIQVAGGQVTGHRGIRFGGIACVPATAVRPARIRIAESHTAGDWHRDCGRHPGSDRCPDGQRYPESQWPAQASGLSGAGGVGPVASGRWRRAGEQRRAREFDTDLREGDTFRVAGQTWRLDAIHDAGHSWHADLTCVTPWCSSRTSCP
ncbi:MAG: DUF6406 domain-containing protein [Micromonosporaceae bacterium]